MSSDHNDQKPTMNSTHIAVLHAAYWASGADCRKEISFQQILHFLNDKVIVDEQLLFDLVDDTMADLQTLSYVEVVDDTFRRYRITKAGTNYIDDLQKA